MAENQGREPEDAEDVLHLKFLLHLGGDDNVVLFRLKRHCKIKNAIDYLCTRRSLDAPTLHFYYKGKRFAKNKTPDQLGMKSGDQIDVMTSHNGA